MKMTNELATVEQGNPYAIMPVMNIPAAMMRRQMLIDYTSQLMVKGRDFGVVPGTGDKPTLLKPGAEKLASLFGLFPDFQPIEAEMDWTGERHGGEPFFYVRYRCILSRGDMPVGSGIGSCNSWEKKYRYRKGERVCPECGQPAIIKGKAEYGGGWLCYKNKGGCGYKYTDNDQRITSQEGGQVKNADAADLVNTIDKMAQKRALVAAVLIAVNASEFYTQDIEDYSDIVDGEWTPAPAPQKQAPEPPKATPPPPPAPPKATNGTPPQANGHLLYGNGAVVRPQKVDDYQAYIAAHPDGKLPYNQKHLDDWLATLTDDEPQPAPVAEAVEAPLFSLSEGAYEVR